MKIPFRQRWVVLPSWLLRPLYLFGALWLVFGALTGIGPWLVSLVFAVALAWWSNRRTVTVVLHHSDEAGVVIWARRRRDAENHPDTRPDLHFPIEADARDAQPGAPA